MELLSRVEREGKVVSREGKEGVGVAEIRLVVQYLERVHYGLTHNDSSVCA